MILNMNNAVIIGTKDQLRDFLREIRDLGLVANLSNAQWVILGEPLNPVLIEAAIKAAKGGIHVLN